MSGFPSIDPNPAVLRPENTSLEAELDDRRTEDYSLTGTGDLLAFLDPPCTVYAPLPLDQAA
ncbi:MAG TPA: hypothetical protein VMT62_14040 [Syntrophorhabdaceae bacterium]|nr:hypothetical protein [Syntrophorhabdaceae bacterium]